MKIENVSIIVVGIICLTIPIYIVFKGKDKKASILYGILGILSGPVWALCLAFFRESKEVQKALFWDRLIYVNTFFIGPLFFIFSRIFPVRKKFRIIHFSIIFFPVAYFAIKLFLTNSFIKQVIINDQGNAILVGPTYFIWCIWFCLIMSVGIFSMLFSYKKLHGIEKEQAKYIILGAIFPALGTLPTNAILPLFGIYKYIWIGPFFLFLMNLVVAYGITRTRFYSWYQFFLIFFKPLVIFIVFVFILLVLFKYLNLNLKTSIVLMILITSLVISLIFSLIDFFVEKVKKGLIAIKNFDPIQVRDDFSRKIALEFEIDEVFKLLVKTVNQTLKIENVGIACFDEKETTVIEKYYKIKKFDKADYLNIINFFKNEKLYNEPLILYETKYFKFRNPTFVVNIGLQKVINFMEKYKIEVIFPVFKKDFLFCLLFLGPKSGNLMFKAEDIRLISGLATNISIALERGILFNSLADLTETLQSKVDLATIELKNKVKALEDARRRERDLIDIMGHELRTPMSIVKTSFEFYKYLHKNCKETDKDKKSKIAEYEDRIEENIDRELKLIETFLGATKIDKGKLELAKEPVDLIDVINDGILGQEKQAKRKNLKLLFIKPSNEKNFPKIFADRVRIQQIIDNLLSNGVKYTDKGSVIVTIEADDEFATVHVKDTGRGIPEEEIKNLGKKFYRIQQYTENSKKRDLKIVRAGGTGLGLYVVFGLVSAHGGKIWVDSKLGVGSTFHFTIPVYKGQLVKSNLKKEFDVFKRAGYK